MRMEALAQRDLVTIAAVADPVPELVDAALAIAPAAQPGHDLADLLALDLDGVVIATPSALHAAQSLQALEHGLAVFCQKPLGRTAAENQQVIAAAQAHDRLLGVDLSYRYISGMDTLRQLILSGELGQIYAADLTFHNAYGPDKPWFYDPQLAGGGCVIDLGIHLVDLALWMLDFPAVEHVTSRLFAGGQPLQTMQDRVEDYAAALIDLANGTSLRLACSWHLPAGCDAVIEAAFYGSQGGAALRNVNGSFYDFTVERFQGTARQLLSSPPDDWGGRALEAWAARLAHSACFDPAIEHLVHVAETLDAMYQRV